ncbi:MAG: hypothetical protein AAGM38_12480 [Pseudomonadota bacterium]
MCDVRSNSRWFRAAVAAATLALMAAPPPQAEAHPGHKDAEVAIIGTAALDHPTAAAEMRLLVTNRSEAPVTLRGLRAAVSAEITIERARGESWERVDALEVGPGEEIRLEQPAYRVLVETRAPQRFTEGGLLLIVAAFDPLGDITAHDRR